MAAFRRISGPGWWSASRARSCGSILQGIAVPKLEEGAIGPVARALGGASLPLFERFLIDQNTLMRDH